MVKLSYEQRQKVIGGVGIPPAAIALLHGIIHITWAVLDLTNIISDSIPKPSSLGSSSVNPSTLNFENNLINSRVTIFS